MNIRFLFPRRLGRFHKNPWIVSTDVDVAVVAAVVDAVDDNNEEDDDDDEEDKEDGDGDGGDIDDGGRGRGFGDMVTSGSNGGGCELLSAFSSDLRD